jgi:hypothetical protein
LGICGTNRPGCKAVEITQERDPVALISCLITLIGLIAAGILQATHAPPQPIIINITVPR